MTTTNNSVYVVGAAGHQGAAALQHLRRLGVEAHAMFRGRDVRDLLDPRAAGPRTRPAHFDDPDELEIMLRGAGALILILEDPDTGPAERLRYGRAVIDAAVAAGVGRIVFVAATGPDHHRLSCDVSAETTNYLQGLNLPVTVLRPATLMEEVPWYWLNRYGRELVLTTPFVTTAHLPLIALDDIGALAALAATRPQGLRADDTVDLAGETLDLAGDTRTPLEIAAELEATFGERVRHEEVQVEGVFVYQEASTQVHDIERLRSLYPPLHTFSSWLHDSGLELCRREVGRAAGNGERRTARV